MAKVYKRTDRDCWVADYRDHRGKRVRKMAATRTEADQLLADGVNAAKKARPGDEPEDADVIRLEEYAGRWLEDVEGELAKRTLHDYTSNLTKHALPALGHLRLKDISPRVVKAFLREKRGHGYAKNTVRLMRAALSVVLSDAIEDGYIDTNPAISKGGRRKKHPGAMSKSDRIKSIRPMSYVERERFLAAAYDFDLMLGALFETMVKTGLRPGEALVLRVDDLDFSSRRVRVERAVSMREVKETKTSEIRDVDLSADLTELLRGYVGQLRSEALRNGWGEPEWLFPSVTNTPRDQSHVAQTFRRVLKKAKLPAFRLYDLRHTFASLLLARCAPITYVAAQLGHAKPTTTLAFYAHHIPTEGTSFADLLDSVPSEVGTKVGTKTGTEGNELPEVVVTVGSPGWIRTNSLRINSPGRGLTATC